MKKIIAYISIVIASAYGIRELIYIGLTKNEHGIFDKYTTAFNKANNYETVIIGSSRAESHFNTRIIDSALHTDCFNLGIEGATLPFALDIFNAYLEKSAFPKNVILNIDFHIRKCDNDTVVMFPRFFPYLKNETLYNALKKRDKRFIGFRYLPFYGLAYMGDNFLSAAIHGYMNKPGKYDLNYYKGYTSLLPVKWSYESYYACDDKAVYDRLDTLAALCKAHQARLIVVLSPMYYKGAEQVLNKSLIIQKVSQRLLLNNVPLLDYSNDTLSQNFDCFADLYHMNEQGSKLFSCKLVKDLKPYFH